MTQITRTEAATVPDKIAIDLMQAHDALDRARVDYHAALDAVRASGDAYRDACRALGGEPGTGRMILVGEKQALEACWTATSAPPGCATGRSTARN